MIKKIEAVVCEDPLSGSEGLFLVVDGKLLPYISASINVAIDELPTATVKVRLDKMKSRREFLEEAASKQ